MMMRIFGISRKVAGSVPEIDEYDFVEDDLSSWEVVVPSSSDDEPYSLSDEDLENDVVLEIGVKLDDDDTTGGIVLKQDDSSPIGSPSSDVSMGGSPPPAQITVADLLGVASVDLNGSKYGQDYYPDYALEDEEDDYDYDFDDDLIPYCARNKFVKQRMKKQNKMAIPRMSAGKQKRVPCYYKIR